MSRFFLRARPQPSRAMLALALSSTAVCLALPYRAMADVQLTNCDDSGAGSLRQALLDVGSGGTIDATQLTNVCTNIIVESAQLSFAGGSVTILGPGAGLLNITTFKTAGSIRQHFQNRLLSHTGTGTLTLENLTMTGGLVNSSATTGGGCIQSSGSVKLIDTIVTGCTVNATAQAIGGAIQASGNVYLSGSSVVNSTASGTNYGALGGGISAGSITLRQATVAGNTAEGSTGAGSVVNGGGINASALDIASSTISGNTASGGKLTHDNVQSSAGGGIYASGMVSISDSTVSGNSAGYYAGARIGATTATIANSTFAFNHSSGSSAPGVRLSASSALTIDSDIFSNNTAGSTSTAHDLVIGGTVTPTGSHNLVFATTSPTPSGTLLNTCPLLAPLANNGGPTQTHALYSHSPARDAGDNAQGQSTDQRGAGFPRVSGSAADIGAYEVQVGDEVFGTGFDSC